MRTPVSSTDWDKLLATAQRNADRKDPNLLGLNIMLWSEPGAGKTASVEAALIRNGLKWISFSGALTDPWIELSGIPMKQIRTSRTKKQRRLVRNPITGKLVMVPRKNDSQEKHDQFFLDFIRPNWVRQGIQVIFIDEFNRAPKKTLNAIMQLVNKHQVDSDTKIPSLISIIAACNFEEEDDESNYVNILDRAMIDRFHIHRMLPYCLNKEFMIERYGELVAKGATQWWNNLSEKNRDLCSPRNMQYALDLFLWENVPLDYVIHYDLRPVINELAVLISRGTPEDELRDLLKKPFKTQEKYMATGTKFAAAKSILSLGNPEFNPLIKAVAGDDLGALVNESEGVKEYVCKNMDFFEKRLIGSTIINDPKIKQIIEKNNAIAKFLSDTKNGATKQANLEETGSVEYRRSRLEKIAFISNEKNSDKKTVSEVVDAIILYDTMIFNAVKIRDNEASSSPSSNKDKHKKLLAEYEGRILQLTEPIKDFITTTKSVGITREDMVILMPKSLSLPDIGKKIEDDLNSGYGV